MRHKSIKRNARNAVEEAVEEPTARRSASTEFLIPASQMKLGSEDGHVIYDETEEKMKAAVDRHRKELAALEVRGSGRVTPAILDPIRVALPDMPAPGPRLNEIATIGVREGTTLLVSVYDESSLKHVEKAIYTAQIPHVVPQKVDAVTIKIPMPKPTVEARKGLITQAAKMTEELRVQMRRTREAAEKKANLRKHHKGFDELHKLMTKYVGEGEKALENMKKKLE
ncbi:ribosome recycling factor domain-containing protein [Auriculariales sp. MPI-PUGE-AT-0066]|nr:ribosome recycling factor domain-containing protein [Auriculariales sp. MPI-PUGE-AT-0066]